MLYLYRMYEPEMGIFVP